LVQSFWFAKAFNEILRQGTIIGKINKTKHTHKQTDEQTNKTKAKQSRQTKQNITKRTNINKQANEQQANEIGVNNNELISLLNERIHQNFTSLSRNVSKMLSFQNVKTTTEFKFLTDNYLLNWREFTMKNMIGFETTNEVSGMFVLFVFISMLCFFYFCCCFVFLLFSFLSFVCFFFLFST
jgi:hypothetical protein